MTASLLNADFMTALVGAAIGSGGVGSAWFASRSKRHEQAQQLFDKIMEGVRAENAGLREEVEACKKRDARAQVLEVVVRSQMEALRRIAPVSPALHTACQLLKSLPMPEHDPEEWAELLARVDAAIPDYQNSEKGADDAGQVG